MNYLLYNRKLMKEEITLDKILAQFSDEGKKLIWSIFFLDAQTNFEESEYLGNIVWRILETNGDKKFIFSWEEIYAISNRFVLITGLILVACKSTEIMDHVRDEYEKLASKGLGAGKNLNLLYDILIDVDDDDLLGVFAKDKKIEERCKSKFGPYPRRLYLPE